MMVFNILVFGHTIGKCQASQGATLCLASAAMILASDIRVLVFPQSLLIEGFGCGGESLNLDFTAAPAFYLNLMFLNLQTPCTVPPRILNGTSTILVKPLSLCS